MDNIPEKVNLSDIKSHKVNDLLLGELRNLFARAEEQKSKRNVIVSLGMVKLKLFLKRLYQQLRLYIHSLKKV
ncbi:hypothetical protein [Pediococcus pentosaceus]|uniref:hypothetical protein n=1 Tax=Pediococcus pentosaceus TaxID=1255 RepID=UPI002880738A|nr:hypothetical protein [Pediococcus pentosaceus]